MSDTASHCNNQMIAALEKYFGVDRRFSVANCPWSNGTYERMMREVVRTLQAMIQEEGRNTQDWVELVPAVQWALNTAFREMYGSTRYHVIFDRAPRIVFSTLASPTGQDWRVGLLLIDEKALRAKVQSVVAAQSQLRKEVLDKVQASTISSVRPRVREVWRFVSLLVIMSW